MTTSSPLSILARLVGAVSVVALVALAVGCADLVDPEKLEDFYHPAGWTDPGGENFHGTYVFDSPSELTKCTTCHGAEFEGELKAPACSECHDTYPHTEGWLAPATGGTHGVMALAHKDGIEGCASCHGASYEGGAEAPACYTCHETYPHRAGWMSPASGEYHGTTVLEAEDGPESCATCHGEDYSGEATGVACSTCHEVYPHEVGFSGSAVSMHDDYMRGAGAWHLDACTSCHGSTYDGNGWDEKTCLTCHSDENGPENCSTCHGSGEEGGPPPDLYGRTGTTNPGVGAHAVHVALGEGAEACATCHVVPESYGAAGHIDDQPARAEVTFGGISAFAGASPRYDVATSTCSSSYCHGGWTFNRATSPYPFGFTAETMTGNAPDVVWTSVGTGQAACGTCHGLPPTNHWDQTLCQSCHPRGPNGTFPDPATHIDGRIDALGDSRSAEGG